MKLSQALRRRLSGLAPLQGMVLEAEETHIPMCIVKIPPGIQFTSGELDYFSVTTHGDTSYGALAFNPPLLIIRLEFAYACVLTEAITFDLFNPLRRWIDCLLDLSQEEGQRLCQLLLKASLIDLVAVAADAAHTVLGWRKYSWDNLKREQMGELVSEFVMKGRGVEAPWATSALVSAHAKRLSQPEDKYPGFVTYQARVQHLHVRQYTFTRHHHLSAYSLPEQELAAQLADITHKLDLATCEEARPVQLTVSIMGEIKSCLGRDELGGQRPFPLPSTHLWLEASPPPLQSISRKASGLLFASPRRSLEYARGGWAEQERAVKLVRDRTHALGDAWRLEVVDMRGFPFLRLLYFPETGTWCISPTHYCPAQRCTLLPGTSRDRFFGELQIAPCQRCRQEADWWQRYVAVVMPLIQQQLAMEKKTAATRSEETTLTPQRPLQETLFDPLVYLPYQLRTTLAPIYSMLKWVPPLLGTMSLEPEAALLHGRGFVGNIIIAFKLPGDIALTECTAEWGAPETMLYAPQGPLVCIPVRLVTSAYQVTIPSLLSPLDRRDEGLLSLLRTLPAARVRLIALSGEEVLALHGEYSLDWDARQQKQLEGALDRVGRRKQGTSGGAKARWWREQGIKLIRSISPPVLAPPDAPPAPLQERSRPTTLIEQYLVTVFETAGGFSRWAEPTQINYAARWAVESLKRAYSCHLSPGVLRMLYELLSRQMRPLRGRLPSFGPTNLWVQFPEPVASPYGEVSVDVAAVWFRKEPSRAAPSEWTCTLIGSDAHPVGTVYRYAPQRFDCIWRVTDAHICPDQACRRVAESNRPWQLCQGCDRGLSFWATALHLLLCMWRGDYTIRIDGAEPGVPQLTVDEERIEDRRVIRSSSGSEGVVPVTRTIHTLRAIDVTVQEVSPYERLVSRASWLAILQATHPELVETAVVKTRAFTRRIKKSGKEVPVPPYLLTVHRRKGRRRGAKLTAHLYESQVDTTASSEGKTAGSEGESGDAQEG